MLKNIEAGFFLQGEEQQKNQLSLLKTDPANAKGPLATIIQGFLSVTIYFSIASLLL